MDGTATYTQFMDQPVSQLDPKELLDLAKKNLKIFGEIEQKQFKRLESQLKYEEKINKKEKDNHSIQERKQEELDKIKEENFKKEFNRAKEQKENFDKIKSFSISDVISSRTQTPEVGKSQEEFYSKNQSFNEKIKSTLELIPIKIQEIIKKPQDEKTGEQKNIGEDIMRVSFNKEGIQILKTLLEPIYIALKANTENLDKLLKKITDNGDSGGSGGWLALLALGVTSLIKYIYIKVMAALRTIELFKTKFFQLIELIKSIPERIMKFLRENKIIKFLQEKWTAIIEGIKDFGRYIATYWDEFIVKPIKEKWKNFIKIFNFDDLKIEIEKNWTKFIQKIKSFFAFDGLISNLEKAGDRVKGFFSGMKKLFFDFTEMLGRQIEKIKFLFTPEGFFGNLFEWIKGMFKSLEGPFEIIKNLGGKATGFFKFFGKILGPLALLIDPVVTAIKGFYSLWGDESLSPLQKGIAIFTGIVASFGDIFTWLIDMVSQGVTGLWNFFTGKGWKTENPVSEYIEKDVYRGQGGFGAGATEGTADMMREYNKRGAAGLTRDLVEGGIYRSTFGLVDVRSKTTDFSTESQKRQKRLDEINEDGVISDEELKEIESFKPTAVDDFIMQPKGVSSYIMDKSTGSLYQTSPNDEIIATKKGGIIDKSLEELKAIMTSVNQSIQNLNNNMGNIQPTIISNNSNTNTGGDEYKKYMFKPIYDVNTDKRALWWKTSRDYCTGT